MCNVFLKKERDCHRETKVLVLDKKVFGDIAERT